eukprot:TRINITY_DN5586_c0_g2_i1.p2 TRINITY_DN5586_c0_g2~~TRINITY_DN5586_c0_g2_i1.p2  ORF type:complete len:520 (+),score=166.69 TRINITY_DN5586_c0_g2_i1:60-1619(+)
MVAVRVYLGFAGAFLTGLGCSSLFQNRAPPAAAARPGRGTERPRAALPAAPRRRAAAAVPADCATAAAPGLDVPKGFKGVPYVTFPTTEMEKQHASVEQGFALTPDCPTGACALALARELGYPDRWGARMRPSLFMLGPPKTGTTFLASCVVRAMVGNARRRPYPQALERWPVEKDPTTHEPLIKDSPIMEARGYMWNRTGYRRWDFPKEWWGYSEMNVAKPIVRAYQPLRLPPVEAGSADWVLMDATPNYLMQAHSADTIALDLAGAPFEPRFLITYRNALSRGFSHYLLMSTFATEQGFWTNLSKTFVDELDRQHEHLVTIPVCRELLTNPDSVMREPAMVSHALRACMYEQPYAPWRKMNFLMFGFVELAARYWLTKFPKSAFRFAKQADIKKVADPAKVMDFLAQTYDLEPVKPKCDDPRAWAGGTCTGAHRYDRAWEACGKDSQAGQSQSWTHKAKQMGYAKGSDARLAKYKKLADMWDARFDRFLAEEGLLLYDVEAGRYRVPGAAERPSRIK